jgi:hypothetical protein
LSYDPAPINFRSGAGSHYGTFSGPVGAFSPVDKAKKGYKSSGRNFTTNPAKKGTGYGYLGVTIGPTPKYTPDPYERAKEIRNVSMLQDSIILPESARMSSEFENKKVQGLEYP